jgi:peptidoglycan/LPS O-acetylase OafA/YrhL
LPKVSLIDVSVPNVKAPNVTAGGAIAPRTRYLPTLDGWRGIAILAVLFCHIPWPQPNLARLAPYGALGVDLFFALSGFLITTRLIAEFNASGRIDWCNFYLRRAFRILPPALLYLLAVTILGLVFRVIPMDSSQLLASLFFYRNYLTLPASLAWYTGHFWSLAVEEHFYLLWPLVLGAAGLRRAIFAAPLMAVAVCLWRAFDASHHWTSGFNPLARTDYRLDALLWGCAMALLWSRPAFRTAFGRIAGSKLAAASVAAIAVTAVWEPAGYLAMRGILMSLLPAATVMNPTGLLGRILEWRPLAWVGRISYSLYLWQQLFFPRSPDVPDALGPLQHLPLSIAGAFLAASISYYWVERPMIAFGKVVEAGLGVKLQNLGVRSQRA